MNKADGQLQVAHVILRYQPISLAFKDPRLHHISVAYEGFIVPEGVPILEGTPFTQPLFMGIPSVGASPSWPIDKEEEEEEEKEKESEEVVDLSDS